ncbi:MAG: VOC family protein [Actinomycetota bacterium]
MATVTRYRNGVPSWADVAVSDIAAGTAFYASLFGWDAADQGPESGHYTMFSADGHSVAALGPKQHDEGMPLWNAYVTVDDLDAVLGSVEGAGGSIVMPRMDIMTSGSMAIITDPSAAVVSLWQPGDHIGAERVNEPNSICWMELTTRDAPAAMAFFGEVLGWSFQGMDESESAVGGYQMVMVGDRVVGGVLPMEGDDWGDLPSHWMVYLAVADTDVTAARVTELGGAVSVPPFDTPIGRTAVVNDPDGNAFSIIQLAAGVDDLSDGIA